MSKLAISVLYFKEQTATIECLLSIQNLKKESIDVSVVLVDNNPEARFDADISVFEDLKIELIKNEKNLGFAGGHNVGISYALRHRASHVLLLNNDTTLDANLLAELIKISDFDTHIGIAVPKIYFSPGSEFHKDRYEKKDLGRIIWYAGGMMDWKNVIGHHRGVDEVDNGQYDTIVDTDFATGACMLVKKEVFEKVGKFDERYFLYYEDSDFSMKVRKAGFKIEYVPTAFMWHKNAGSAGGSGSELQDYYITRNRLLFGTTYAPLKSRAALLRESLRLLVKGRKWQRRGVVDFYLRRFGRGSYGSVGHLQ